MNAKLWYAVYTRSRHEKNAAMLLARRNIKHYLPLLEISSRWKDRTKIVEKPLFPGYLFVHIAKNERSEVLQVKGVVDLLFNRKEGPAIVPDRDIINIRNLLKSGLRVDPCPFLKAGQLVRIKKGPLKDVEGIFVRKLKRRYLVVSVDVLGQSVSVEMPADNVSAVG
ncbi:UpxY family transcription antiterminator [Verrucomicrobiota bacterium]